MEHKFFEQDWAGTGLANVRLLSIEGAFSSVFVADIWQGRRVLKVSIPEKGIDTEGIAEREAKAGYLINSVPELSDTFVKTIGMITSDQLPPAIANKLPNYNGGKSYVIVQEFVASGKTLKVWLIKAGSPSKDVIRAVLFQLVHALSVANATLGFQHNDIKMDNVMVTEILTAQDRRKYVMGEDVFEIVFPKGTPLIKFIDYGASIVRLSRNEQPLGLSDMLNYPMALDLMIRSRSRPQSRKNDADMMGVFGIAMNMICNNAWAMTDGDTWQYYGTFPTENNEDQAVDVMGYTDDLMNDKNNVNLVTQLVGRKLNDTDFRVMVQLLFMREGLEMTGDIPYDASLPKKVNEALGRISAVEKLNLGGDGNFFANIHKTVDDRIGKYGLMFVQRLFGATQRERLGFGVTNSKYAFANALYHPYFSADLYVRTGVNPKSPEFDGAYKTAEPGKPLEYQPASAGSGVRATLAKLQQNTETEMLHTSTQKREKAQVLDAQESALETAKKLEEHKRTLEANAKKLAKLQADRKAAEALLQAEDESTEEEALAERTEELKNEEKQAKQAVDEMSKLVEKEKEELEDDIEELEEEMEDVVDEKPKAEIMDGLRECLDKFLDLNTVEDLARVRTWDDVKEEESGCSQDVIELAAFTRIAENDDNEEDAKDAAVETFDNIMNFTTKKGLGYYHTPGYFQTDEKYQEWKITRFGVLYANYIGAILKYLDEEYTYDEVAAVAGETRALALIETKEEWVKAFKPALMDRWRTGPATAVSPKKVPVKKEPQKKEEQAVSPKEEPTTVEKDINTLEELVKLYENIYDNSFRNYVGNKTFDDLDEKTQEIYMIMGDTERTDDQLKLFEELGTIPGVIEYDDKGSVVIIVNESSTAAKSQWLVRRYALIYGKLAELVRKILENGATTEDVARAREIMEGAIQTTTANAFNLVYPKARKYASIPKTAVPPKKQPVTKKKQDVPVKKEPQKKEEQAVSPKEEPTTVEKDINTLNELVKLYGNIHDITFKNYVKTKGLFDELDIKTREIYTIMAKTEHTEDQLKLFKKLGTIPGVIEYNDEGSLVTIENESSTAAKSDWTVRRYAIIYGKLAKIVKKILENDATTEDVVGAREIMKQAKGFKKFTPYNKVFPTKRKYASILENIERDARYAIGDNYDWPRIESEIFTPLQESMMTHEEALAAQPAIVDAFQRLGMLVPLTSFTNALPRKTQYLHSLSVAAQILDHMDNAQPVPPELIERLDAEWPISISE